MLRPLNVFKVLLGLFVILIQSNLTLFASNQITDKGVYLYLTAANNDIKDLTKIDFSESKPDSYLSISKFYLSDAQDLVFESLSNEFVVSEKVIRDVVRNNLQYENLNNSNVRARYEQASKDIKKIQKQKITTFAREVFMNNETSDSPFDLIKDLEKLEKLLFNFQSEVLLDGMYKSESLSGLPMGFSNVSLSSLAPGSDSDTPQLSTDDERDDTGSDVTGTPPTQAGAIDIIQQPESSECDLDPDLNDQLDQINQNNQDSNENDQDNTSSGGSNNQEPSSPENTDAQDENEQVSSQNNSTTALPFSDYPTLNDECPEDQIFCLKQEEIMGRWGLVIPEDKNCIACKVSQIKAGMSQVLAVNLVPKKVTGNFGEFPYCKEELKKSLIIFDFKILSRPMRASDPTTEVTTASVEDILPTRSPAETSTLPTTNILEADPEAQELERAIQAANAEADLFTDEINDLKQGYEDIVDRMNLFNKHMKSISTALKSLRDNANELTTKSTCE